MKSKIIKWYERAGLITEGNREIVKLGLNRIMSTTISCFFSVICAGIMGDCFAGLLFEGSYMLLRSFTGGYHARNRIKCLVLTYTSSFCSIVLVFVTSIKQILICTMIFIFNLIICYFTPIQNENKPINSVEKKVYHKKSIAIASIETMLFFIFVLAGLDLYEKVIFFSMLLVVLGMFVELVKDKKL